MRRFEIFDVLLEFKFVTLKKAGLTGEKAKSLNKEELQAIPQMQSKMKEALDRLREVTGNNIPILHRIFVRIQGVIMKEYWNLPSLLQRRIRAKRQVRCVDYFL